MFLVYSETIFGEMGGENLIKCLFLTGQTSNLSYYCTQQWCGFGQPIDYWHSGLQCF